MLRSLLNPALALALAATALAGPPLANPVGPLEAVPASEADDAGRVSVSVPASDAIPTPAERADSSEPTPAEDPEASPADAEPASPDALAQRTRAIESLPLGRPAETEAAPADADPAQERSILDHPAVRTAGALTLVISLIFGLRTLMQTASRRGHGLAASLGAGGRAPSGVLSVLGRYPVGRGMTLVLLQLDRRVLLLSQTGSGFQTLCELTDAEEVASVISKTADDEGASLSKRFSSMLRSFERDPSIAGDDYEVPLSPRRAMALREYESSIGVVEAPGSEDSVSSMRRRLDRLRGERS